MKLALATLLLVLLLNSASTQQIPVFVQDCAVYDADGRCSACVYRFVLKRQKCIQVSYLCDQFDSLTGKCLTCIDGFKLCKGVCKLNDEGIVVPKEPEIFCPPRSVAISGRCVAVSDLCRTWSSTTALCETCYVGYKNSGGVCVIDNGSSGSVVCPPRTVKIQGTCRQVSDLCRTWYDNGDCETCYVGYELVEGACVVGNTGGSSGQCAYRYVYIGGSCVAVSDQCYTWSQSTGDCLSCYDGYTLWQGSCVI